MVVFDQLRFGRFKLYSAALKESISSIKDAWKKEMLGKLYTIRPINNQVVGEEVLDKGGRVIAVFGVAVTNVFTPKTESQQKYLGALTKLVQSS